MPRYDQCDGTCTVDCGHCKGRGRPGASTATRHQLSLQPGTKAGLVRLVCACGYRAADDWPETSPGARTDRVCPEDKTVVALVTLQFGWGGLFNPTPAADQWAVHLVRRAASGGTPGPTLCGVDRFADDAPGWSVGGGTTGPDIVHTPCPGCTDMARQEFLGLPVCGSIGGREMAATLGVEYLS